MTEADSRTVSPKSAAPHGAPDTDASAGKPWHGVAHYENFPVASWLVPSAMRPAVTALYRFARYADDVADEGEHPAGDRLAELARLEHALDELAPRHPLVAPLMPHLAAQPQARDECRALLSAFRQDVSVNRHADFAALQDYCSRSAAPVGRLMLGLFGCRREALLAPSDAICTALQLINFLQDMAIDWTRGRLYIALDELNDAGLSEDDIDRAVRAGRADAPLRGLVASQARRCAALLEAGAPMVSQVPWRLGLELRGVLAGGRCILEKLARDGYDPFARRPRIRASDVPTLLRLAFSPARL